MSTMIVMLTAGFVAILCGAGIVDGNPGLHFILVFPQSDRSGDDNPTLLLTPFYQSDRSIQVTVRGANTNFSDVINLNWGNPRNYNLQDNFQLDEGCHVTDNKTLLVEASHLITIVVRNRGWSNTDSYLALPVPLLGIDYMVLAFTPISGGPNSIAVSFLVVTSLAQTTEVTVRLPHLPEMVSTTTHGIELDDVLYLPGDVITVNLDPYHSIQLQAFYDLSGAIVQSDTWPIGVWSGLNRTKIGNSCWSHVITMLPTIQRMGRHYVLAPPPPVLPSSIYRIMAIHWMTRITIHAPTTNGNTTTGISYLLPRPGSYVTYESINATSFEYVESSRPITVGRFVASHTENEEGDASLLVLSALDSVNRTYYRIGQAISSGRFVFYTLIASREILDFITLDGAPLAANMTGVTFDTEITQYNVTGRYDLVAMVMRIYHHNYFSKFVLQYTSTNDNTDTQLRQPVFIVYADSLMRDCEGESYPLGSPGVVTDNDSANETDSRMNGTQKHCLALDGDNKTSMVFKGYGNGYPVVSPPPDSYSRDRCCIKDTKLCQCSITTTTNQCQSLSQYRQASSNSTVIAPSLLACRHKCQARDWCLGVNFAPLLPATSPNCQLLGGYFRGLLHDGTWQFLHCFTLATFKVTQCDLQPFSGT